jgi:prolipoprotein diacylglyceryltransferase
MKRLRWLVALAAIAAVLITAALVGRLGGVLNAGEKGHVDGGQPVQVDALKVGQGMCDGGCPS